MLALGAASSGGLAWPRLAKAQRKGLPRVGYFSLISIREPPSTERLAFLDGLRELGLLPGKTVEIIYRSAENLPEFVDDIFGELLKARVDVAVVINLRAIQAALKATSTLPLVMLTVGDPVDMGFVKSLGRPGGNVTGVAFLSTELAAKRIQMLRDIHPATKRIAVIWHAPNRQAHLEADAAIAAAKSVGWLADRHPVNSAQDVPRALERIAEARPDALYVVIEAVIVARSATFAQFGLRHRIAVVSGYSGITEAGGLLSYSPNIPAMYRRAAYYVHRILGGTSPADLPVEQPSVFEKILNLRTARALRIQVPKEAMVLVDRVIE